MGRMYLLSISVELAALLGLTACIPAGGGMMGSGGLMDSGVMMVQVMMGGWGRDDPNTEQNTMKEAADAGER